MDRSSSVLALTLLGVGASVTVAARSARTARQRSEAIYSARRAAELTGSGAGGTASVNDPTHRDGSAEGSELRQRFNDNGAGTPEPSPRHTLDSLEHP